jgi:Protein of unknown function (DUF3467)
MAKRKGPQQQQRIEASKELQEDSKELQEAVITRSPLFAKQAEQKRIRTERYTRIYANNLAVVFSIWDMSITFGEIIDGHGEVPIIEEVVHITLSQEFAKLASQLLSANIAQYEQQFGEIEIRAPKAKTPDPADA